MLGPALEDYFRQLGIGPELYAHTQNVSGTELSFTLATPPDDTNTLDFKYRPAYAVTKERVFLPAKGGKTRAVDTVSRKEIALALLQHGRVTKFAGKACSLEAFVDHVNLRQAMVAWSEVLEWNWPNGGPAKWNPRFWDRGTPRREVAEALMDAFTRQERYTIGCYTAVKMVIAHAVVDYYGRMKTSREQLAEVHSRLWADGDPLVNIEPARIWKFEAGFDPARWDDPGKLLRIEEGVAAGNFVPGDWAYILNTDQASSLKTGYEGSNAIYMGQNRFSDYYNDNDHSYAYREKLDAVYQWRHGVFSRSRHAAKLVPLSLQDYERLGKTPEEGGLVLNIRLVPHLFGYEALPAWVPPPFPKPHRGQDVVLEQTP